MWAERTSRSTAPERWGRRRRVRRRGRPALLGCALLAAGVLAAGSGPATPATPATLLAAHTAHARFACSKPNSAHIPCYFSTPSGNIRCEWTPHSQAVKCVLVTTRKGYVLHPTGKAKAIKVTLVHKGETLPTSQQIVFPQKLSCEDSKTSITCNQDEGSGFFEIGPHSSKSH